MEFEELIKKAYDNDAQVVEMDFNSDTKGLCIGKCIVLNSGLESTSEKRCILAEELGHYFTTVGNITKIASIDDRKQERLARGYAFNMLIGFDGIIRAWQNGCTNLSETADFLDVTEKFAADAIVYYGEKCGKSTVYGDYEITFVPCLNVKKRTIRYKKVAII